VPKNRHETRRFSHEIGWALQITSSDNLDNCLGFDCDRQKSKIGLTTAGYYAVEQHEFQTSNIARYSNQMDLGISNVGSPVVTNTTINEWVSCGTEARPCHERDVLAICLAGRQTQLQQSCRSLTAVPASPTLLHNTTC